MIKTLIYKLLKYLLGIDIPKLLSDNQKLESSNSLLKHINIDSEKHNKLLNEQLHNKEELLLAAINELEVLKTENAALKTETTVAHSNLISLKAKKDEDLHANQTLTIEKEKLKENLKTLQGQILSVESRLNDSELKFTGQVNEISNLHEQLALIKANESKQSEIISELKKIESKYIAQKDEISNLNEQLIPYKESESNQSEMIRNLKERVSQLQAEAVNSKTKDNIIETLRKNIDSGNEKISALQSDIDLLRSETVPPVISHKEELSPKTLQKVDDVIVEHIGRNIGKRSSKSFETGENGFDYIGLFLFNLRQFNKLDSSDFPDVFYPKFNTPVLKWHKAKSNTTTGVTEPILMKAVNSIKEHAPDIEILTNIALSIRNRDYSYRPDLALFWPKHNLCIDIEIDEPYDIVSRKPLHYIGSSDYLRNLYFNSQGWVVIRFSEEQVNSKTEDCLKYISLVLKIITTESSFDSLLLDFKPEFVPRWTYEQAQEYAIDMYREKYLNLDTIVDLDPAIIDESPFSGIPPSEDILPEIDYSIIEGKLNSIANRYIKITQHPYEDQLILENHNQEVQKFKKGIAGFNLVEEKSAFVPFEIIIDIEGLDSPYKYPLYNNPGSENNDKLYELVKEAIYNCNPVRMEYEDGKADITFRNIAMNSYEGDSKEHFGDYMWANYYENKGSMITSFCMLREAQRHFYIHRIQAIQLFDIKFLGLGHITSFRAGLWYPLKKGDLQLCDHISKLIPSYLIETDLTTAGNYAHYLLVSGSKDEAIGMYKKYDGKMVTKEIGWSDMILQDFADLKDLAGYKEKFDEAVALLGWAYRIVSQ